MKLQLSEEFYDYADKLEKEWRKSLLRITDKELITTFPEVKYILPEKIKEQETEKQEIVDIMKKNLILIKHNISDELSIWFWKEWVKANEGVELLEVEKHIMRLKRLLFAISGKKTKNFITEEQVQQALVIPIENLINKPLRKCGKTLVGLCPFHEEKHPSFYIYLDTNSFYCFGCNQGGNVINFVNLLYGYSFKEAIGFLIK